MGLRVSVIEFIDIEIENEADLIAVLKKISPFFKWENIGRVLEQGETEMIVVYFLAAQVVMALFFYPFVGRR